MLIGYENEAISAKDEGIELEYVIPDSTILIENPVAVTTDARTTAQKFVDFTRSDEAQQIFADYGYRPVVKSVLEKNADKFPTPAQLFTIDEFGGWEQGRRRVLRRPRRLRRSRSSRSWVTRPSSASLEHQMTTTRHSRRHPAEGGPPGPLRRGGAHPRGRHDLAQPDRPDPARAPWSLRSLDDGLGGVLGRDLGSPRRSAAIKLTVISSLIVVAINAVMGTLIAWVLVRDEFRGQALRQLDHRPALRAADDRRRPDAARPLRRTTARSASTSPTPRPPSSSRCCS